MRKMRVHVAARVRALVLRMLLLVRRNVVVMRRRRIAFVMKMPSLIPAGRMTCGTTIKTNEERDQSKER
jgi:hypothetical protein